MYTTCLACSRSLGANRDLAHLPVGRRIAFDTTTGRLWVVCRHCGQWNLTPAEERWEALAECEAAAATAEARAAGAEVGLAQTRSGLELLRVGGMTHADIANWRYGRRLQARQRRLMWMLLMLPVLATLITIVLGVGPLHDSAAAVAGVALGVALCLLLLHLLLHPPLPVRVPDGAGGTTRLWPRDFRHAHLAGRNDYEPITLVIPRGRGSLRLHGEDAARALAVILPRLNGDDCSEALPDALERVDRAEARVANPWNGDRRDQQPPRRRPWEHLASFKRMRRPADAPPADRLALEMAVTEESEQRAMQARAEALGPAWREQETIGEIADDLLVPTDVAERLRAMRDCRDTEEP